MTADLTREQAREQVARAMWERPRVDVPWEKVVEDGWGVVGLVLEDTDAALTVLWPVVEKYQRGAKTLGEILDRTLLDIVAATDSQDLINEDGDGDWALVHERLAAMGAMVRRAEGLEVEVERLRADLAHAHTVIARHVEPRREGEPRTGGVPIPTEVGVPAPELDGVHERAMEAGQRGVEKMWEEWRARACRPNLGDCCDGSAHTWQPAQGSRLPDRVDGNRPSDALYGDLTDFPCCSGGSGRVDETGGSE